MKTNKTKNRLIITTHSPYVLETFNNHLKKDKIKDIQIEDEQIQNIEALNPEKLNCWFAEKECLPFSYPLISESHPEHWWIKKKSEKEKIRFS